MPCPSCGRPKLETDRWADLTGCEYSGVVCSAVCAQTQHALAEAGHHSTRVWKKGEQCAACAWRIAALGPDALSMTPVVTSMGCGSEVSSSCVTSCDFSESYELPPRPPVAPVAFGIDCAYGNDFSADRIGDVLYPYECEHSAPPCGECTETWSQFDAERGSQGVSALRKLRLSKPKAPSVTPLDYDSTTPKTGPCAIEDCRLGDRLDADGKCGFCGMMDDDCSCGQRQHEIACAEQHAREEAQGHEPNDDGFCKHCGILCVGMAARLRYCTGRKNT